MMVLMDVDGRMEVMERVIEGCRKRPRETKEGGSMENLSVEKERRSTLFHSLGLYYSDSRVSHIKGQGGWSGEMKERHSLYWMCEVHALNIMCMCVKCVPTHMYDEPVLDQFTQDFRSLWRFDCCWHIKAAWWNSMLHLHFHFVPTEMGHYVFTQLSWAWIHQEEKWNKYKPVSLKTKGGTALISWGLQ